MANYDFGKHIGKRIAEKRMQAGISLSKFAKLLDISYQQVSKYESGVSKISVEKLLLICRILNEPISYFCDDIDLANLSIDEETTPSIIDPNRKKPIDIIFVEDNYDDALAISRIFDETLDKKASHKIFSDTTQTIKYLQETPDTKLPGIIFLDISLPLGSGFDLLETVKQDDRLKSIIILMLSGSINWDDMKTSYLKGASGYALKPSSYEKLNKLITDTVNYWSENIIFPNT